MVVKTRCKRGSSTFCVNSCALCNMDDIGPSELLSSWLMILITFFQTSTSWRLNSRVSCLNTNNLWCWLLSNKRPIERCHVCGSCSALSRINKPSTPLLTALIICCGALDNNAEIFSPSRAVLALKKSLALWLL